MVSYTWFIREGLFQNWFKNVTGTSSMSIIFITTGSTIVGFHAQPWRNDVWLVPSRVVTLHCRYFTDVWVIPSRVVTLHYRYFTDVWVIPSRVVTIQILYRCVGDTVVRLQRFRFLHWPMLPKPQQLTAACCLCCPRNIFIGGLLVSLVRSKRTLYNNVIGQLLI